MRVLSTLVLVILVIAILMDSSFSQTASGPPAQRWKRIDADNGSAIAIDLNSIHQGYGSFGAADAIICIVDNNVCELLNQRRWAFDCRGHFMDIDNGGGMVQAPSRSVVGAIAAIACEGTKDTRP
jgi:hypothetical protein